MSIHSLINIIDGKTMSICLILYALDSVSLNIFIRILKMCKKQVSHFVSLNLYSIYKHNQTLYIYIFVCVHSVVISVQFLTHIHIALLMD